jgi:hypothetical protein
MLNAFATITACVLLSFSAKASELSERMRLQLETSDHGVQIAVYESKEDASFYLPAQKSLPAVLEFQIAVRKLTNVDPYFLARRQQRVFIQHDIKDALPRFDFVLKQRLFEISYLEQMLLDLHSEKIGRPLFKSYSEFGANILVGPEGQLAVIFMSNNADATVPETEARKRILKDYLAKGYKFKIHLHNHPFNFDNPDDIAGTTIPSGTEDYGDVSCYLKDQKNFELEQAWITNGFSTIRLQADQFNQL